MLLFLADCALQALHSLGDVPRVVALETFKVSNAGVDVTMSATLGACLQVELVGVTKEFSVLLENCVPLIVVFSVVVSELINVRERLREGRLEEESPNEEPVELDV